jgi:cystathionine beta-lyase/cystathionine gamma-synthase
MKNKISTAAAHAGEEKKLVAGAVAPAIVQTTNFQWKTTGEFEKYLAGDPRYYIYTRYTNPTLEIAERKLAALEKTEKALVFCSGMAAITSTILTLVKSGQEIVATNTLYGGTFAFMTQLLPKLGIKTRFVPTQKVEQAERAINKKTALLYLESPTNPNNYIVDLEKAATIAKKRRIPTALDATFASPFNLHPADFGIDVILHSATKYLGGHSDVTAGFAAGSKGMMQKIEYYRRLLGGVLEPLTAFLLIRGMKTLAVRVSRQNENAQEVAEFLSAHKKIKRIFYLGLPEHPQHELARRQMKGFTGMVAFELHGGLKEVKRVVNRLKLIMHATSLGGVESVVHIPVLTSHIQFSKKELKAADVSEGMLRLSCGIEDAGDLIADLKQALA